LVEGSFSPFKREFGSYGKAASLGFNIVFSPLGRDLGLLGGVYRASCYRETSPPVSLSWKKASG